MYQFVGVPMKIREIAKLLDADVLCGEELLDGEVHSACGCDMMSDVLAFVKEQAVLLTGLCNPQVVRTAEMMDMRCIVFVRGKVPSADIVALAEESGIAVLTSNERMYVACGKLYSNGLSGGSVLNAR
jgi:predicted transcriptional regulator